MGLGKFQHILGPAQADTIIRLRTPVLNVNMVELQHLDALRFSACVIGRNKRHTTFLEP